MQTLTRKKKEPPAPHTEAAITKSIRDLLSHMQIFHWKNWGGMMGTKGVPDILGFNNVGSFEMEFKSLTGMVSQAH